MNGTTPLPENEQDRTMTDVRNLREHLLTVLAPYRALLAARLFLCLLGLRRRSLSDSVSSTRPREEWVAYSFDRFIAAIKT